MRVLDMYVPSKEELEFRSKLDWRNFEKPSVLKDIIDRAPVPVDDDTLEPSCYRDPLAY